MKKLKEYLSRLNKWKRLWLVGSITYIIPTFIIYFEDAFFDRWQSQPEGYFIFLFRLIIPPLAVLAIGYGIYWAVFFEENDK